MIHEVVLLLHGYRFPLETTVSADDLPSRSGLEKARALVALDPMPGLLGSLDLRFIEVEEGRAVFEGVPGPHAYNPMGTVHGGYAATLLDSACGVAVMSRLGPSQGQTTLELKVAYHRAITAETGPVRAEGRVVSLGRRVAFAEASLAGADGRLYASATSTLLVIDR
jgi:uncharacterized protein (TIGR00369 family)